MQVVGSFNSIPSPSLPIEVLANDASHTLQEEVTTRRKESNKQTLTQAYSTHHELSRYARIDVPDFSGEHNIDAFLDWKHQMKDFFRWYDVSEGHELN